MHAAIIDELFPLPAFTRVMSAYDKKMASAHATFERFCGAAYASARVRVMADERIPGTRSVFAFC